MVRKFLTLVPSLAVAAASVLPNKFDTLERVRKQYPHVWAAAHRDYPQTSGSRTTKSQAELYVRIAAWKMNQEDAGTEHEGKWGVNGKRGDRNDLSQDVITYQLRPNWNKGWDVIVGAGGLSPSLGWGEGFEPSPDAAGHFVQGTPITEDEVQHVMNGGRAFAPQPFPWSGVPFADAAAQITTAFRVKHQRELTAEEIALFASWAHALGWDGSDRFPALVVAELVKRATRYSGDVGNPFPTVTVDEALRQLNARWQLRFNRDVHQIELNAIVQYAQTQWDGVGDVPVWLLNEILAHSDAYDGSLVADISGSIDPLSECTVVGPAFALNGEPFQYRGETAFLLFYDYIHAPAQYQAFRDSMVAAGRNVARISVATSTGYLILEPRSGGTYGLGRTAPLYPGAIPDFYPRYRAMLADLAAHGIVAEVVPFLTAGPSFTNPGGSQGDGSVPQMHTAATRLAYMQEVARELLPFRAAFVEVANEYNFIGFNSDGLEIVGLADAYEAIDPLRLVARSAPSGPGDHQNAHLMAGGDYITVHADRRTSPRSWSWVIHQLGLPQLGFGKPVINDEGINADTVGEFGNDATPANHWANGVLMRLVPNLSYTFHYDRALKGLAPAAHDGSLQASNALREGTNAVPANIQGDYIAMPNVLGADAAVARLGATEGWLLLLGATTSVVDVPEWHETLVASAGPHRLYRLSR